MTTTLKQLVYTLGEIISGDAELLDRCDHDYRNLKELVGEFCPDSECVAPYSWDDPKSIVKTILTHSIFESGIDRNYAQSSIIGYGYLLLSHLQFREKEVQC